MSYNIVFWGSIVIVFIPLIFQRILGNTNLALQNKKQFKSILIISIILQFCLTLASVFLQKISFDIRSFELGLKTFESPPPLAGVFLSFFVLLNILLIAYIQYQKVKDTN